MLRRVCILLVLVATRSTLFFCVLTRTNNCVVNATKDDWQQQHLSSINAYLQSGDESLIQDDTVTAIAQYERGIHHFHTVIVSQDESNGRMNDDILSTIVSLYTNLATAYSTQGDNDLAIQSYRNAIKIYQKYTQIVEEDLSINYDDSRFITAQSSFFLDRKSVV